MPSESAHKDNVLRVLEFILSKIADKDFNWVLVGSTNLFIQGIDVTAKDIDIVSTKSEILQIEEIFKKYSIKKVTYSESDKYKSYFGRCVIDGIQVDLIADLEYKTPDGQWSKSTSLESKKIFVFKGYSIPVNPIENELIFYEKMNRENDQQKIKLIKKVKEMK
jgi:predicted nucleotidyltransferase